MSSGRFSFIDQIEGLVEAETELDGDNEADGLAEAEGETDGLLELDGDLEADGDSEGLIDGLSEADTEGLLELDGESEAEGEREAEGDSEGLVEGLLELDGDRDGETEGELDEEGDLEADGDKEGEFDGEVSSPVPISFQSTEAQATGEVPERTINIPRLISIGVGKETDSEVFAAALRVHIKQPPGPRPSYTCNVAASEPAVRVIA